MTCTKKSHECRMDKRYGKQKNGSASIFCNSFAALKGDVPLLNINSSPFLDGIHNSSVRSSRRENYIVILLHFHFSLTATTRSLCRWDLFSVLYRAVMATLLPCNELGGGGKKERVAWGDSWCRSDETRFCLTAVRRDHSSIFHPALSVVFSLVPSFLGPQGIP